MQINHLYKILKSLFTSPIGTFPTGGIETSMGIKLTYTPKKIILEGKGGISSAIYKQEELWKVNVEGDITSFITLDEALFELLKPYLQNEISIRITELNDSL